METLAIIAGILFLASKLQDAQAAAPAHPGTPAQPGTPANMEPGGGFDIPPDFLQPSLVPDLTDYAALQDLIDFVYKDGIPYPDEMDVKPYEPRAE